MSYLGSWDCFQGANYSSSQILPVSVTQKDSTSELKNYIENADIIQLSSQAFQSGNYSFPIDAYSYLQQQLPEQHQQMEDSQLIPQPQLQLSKMDIENLLCDLTASQFEKSNKEEILGSPVSSSSSLYEESSESEKGEEIVDEIIRNHMKNLPDLNDDNDSQYSSSSFMSTSDDSISARKINSINSMSPISNHDWPLSISTTASTYDEYASSQENLQQINDQISDDGFNESDGQTLKIKKRSRLYVRNTDEKKSRKKEQNKNAATRYRQKKKMEMKLDLDEERVLLDKNVSLRKTVEECQREVKYLKKLIREFHKKEKK